ncbi:MAG: hypothetical protein HY902_18700 [Deltaproteobacteria bacterium]|nr:hypothetical protein [Deltaproteobacteria bacterium]
MTLPLFGAIAVLPRRSQTGLVGCHAAVSVVAATPPLKRDCHFGVTNRSYACNYNQLRRTCPVSTRGPGTAHLRRTDQ